MTFMVKELMLPAVCTIYKKGVSLENSNNRPFHYIIFSTSILNTVCHVAAWEF